ncbi:hypothetical protein F5Y06DRAFT_155865 [Hypoxylon sp. FL0890]|nr:hypothetical protein F5Y06DRAFT_155865 [Hypoxylon sp. FL0890]
MLLHLSSLESQVGIVVHAQIDFPKVDDDTQRHIFSLIRRNASASAVAATNFNSTIVMNFTSDSTFYSAVGQAGYSAFTPNLRCWEGVLSDCDDDNGLEGKAARACGLAWFRADESSKTLGQQKYDGTKNVVQTDLGGGPTDPPASYESVANQATNEQGDDRNSAAMSKVDSAALLVALLCWIYGIAL